MSETSRSLQSEPPRLTPTGNKLMESELLFIKVAAIALITYPAVRRIVFKQFACGCRKYLRMSATSRCHAVCHSGRLSFQIYVSLQSTQHIHTARLLRLTGWCAATHHTGDADHRNLLLQLPFANLIYFSKLNSLKTLNSTVGKPISQRI